MDAEKLNEENATFGDLLIGAFTDCYGNLSIKSASMLKWAAIHCPEAAFLLKVDDDVLLNPFYFEELILGLNEEGL